MSTSVTWPCTTGGTASATAYTVPAAGELNWSALSAFLIALGQGAQGTTFQMFANRKAITTPVTVAVTDCVVGSKLTSPAAVVMNLPAGVSKQCFFLFDDTGDADSNNITINRAGSDTIKGATSLVLNHKRAWVFLCFNSADTDWKVVAQGADYTNLSAADITAGTLAVARGGTNLGSGTSGGILGFTGSGVLASSAALTANQLLIGGGAGATPSSLAAGSQGQVLVMGASNPGYNSLINITTTPLSTTLNSTGTAAAYLFTISTSSTVAVGDTYTNNSVTFTVVAALTTATGRVFLGTGSGAPTSSGTLTKGVSSAGPATITFSAFLTLAAITPAAACKYISVDLCGGGGGGTGTGLSPASGATGGDTILMSATHYLHGTGGTGGDTGISGGTGGTGAVTLSGMTNVISAVGKIWSGNAGDHYANSASALSTAGGNGAAGMWGGRPLGGSAGGSNATANTGAGGGAGGGTAGTYNAGNGGASGGGLMNTFITTPDSVFYYIIAAGGGGGSSTNNGGNGATGGLVFREFYS